MPKRVAIVGGGVTGLAAAFELERHSEVNVDLYEAGPRLGGKIGTDRVGGLIVETGPDCFFARKPGVMEFVRELDLDSEVIEPLRNEFSVLHQGKLHRVPRGLAAFAQLSHEAVDAATFLSDDAKVRVKAEPLQPPGECEDESIRSFFTRRFGAEFCRVLAEPLLAGTHGGDPARLSMKALYPHYLDMERRQGSVSTSGESSDTGSRTPAFLSFRGGMQTLVDTLGKSLRRTRVHLNRAVATVSDVAADRVLLAVPANRAATMIAERSPAAAQLMLEITHCSSAVVTCLFDRGCIDGALEGTGFLVPPSQDSAVTGATWSSNKWVDRAPADQALIRVFLGGERATFAEMCDAELGRRAVASVSELLGIHGLPSRMRVVRWIDSLPQYELGHLDRVAGIEAELGPDSGFFVAGTSYRGVGVPDCLRQGREVAGRILETI